MKCAWLVAAVAVLAVALLGEGQAAPPMTQKEVLDLFFKSASARQRLDKALEGVQALGVPSLGPLLSQWRRRGQELGHKGQGATSGVLRFPWESPAALQHLNTVMDDGLGTLVEQVRRVIEAVAEPLKVEHINLNVSNPLVNSVGDITQVTVSQLSTFNLLDLKIDAPTVSAKIKVDFDKLDAHGLYKVDATASDQMHIFGDGRFDIRLYKPTVEVSAQLGYQAEHFSVEELSIYVNLGKLKVVMSNFLGGGEVGDLVCGIVSDVGPAFLDIYREEVNQMASTQIKDTANALLARVPINKIIDWIMGGGSDDGGGGGDDDDDDQDQDT